MGRIIAETLFDEEDLIDDIKNPVTRVFYNEVFEGVVFENIDPKLYIDCTFKDCRFKDTQTMGPNIKQLLKNNNLISCWYNPILLLTEIITSLHEDVNVVDYINKAFIKSGEKSSKKMANKLANKQLVLFEI